MIEGFRRATVWVWHNGAAIGGLSAAVFTGVYVWLTYNILRLQQTPVVTVEQVSAAGELEMDNQLQSVRNSGQGAAFNVLVYQHDKTPEGKPTSLEYLWVGSLGPGESRQLARSIEIGYTEDYPRRFWYQDIGGRWYATRLAATGFGLVSVWEGRRAWFRVPKFARENAKAETRIQFYKRLDRWSWLRRPR